MPGIGGGGKTNSGETGAAVLATVVGADMAVLDLGKKGLAFTASWGNLLAADLTAAVVFTVKILQWFGNTASLELLFWLCSGEMIGDNSTAVCLEL